MYHEEADAQLQRDVAFFVAAWHACLSTLRMHYRDGGPNGQHTIHAMLEWFDMCPGQPVLVMSYSYMHAHARVVSAHAGMVTTSLFICQG
jgi:hypothetical protein